MNVHRSKGKFCKAPRKPTVSSSSSTNAATLFSFASPPAQVPSKLLVLPPPSTSAVSVETVELAISSAPPLGSQMPGATLQHSPPNQAILDLTPNSILQHASLDEELDASTTALHFSAPCKCKNAKRCEHDRCFRCKCRVPTCTNYRAVAEQVLYTPCALHDYLHIRHCPMGYCMRCLCEVPDCGVEHTFGDAAAARGGKKRNVEFTLARDKSFFSSSANKAKKSVLLHKFV